MSLPCVEYRVDDGSGPAEVTLAVKTSCNCPASHEISPSVTAVAKKFRIMREKKKEEAEDGDDAATKKIELKKQIREEFLEKGVHAALYGLLERKVQAAAMCTDHLLNQKREKLRRLLLAEDETYAQEYVALCQAANEAQQEATKRKAIEIKAKKEQECRELAERKILEMKIQDCEPARGIRSQKALKMVKTDQLWQIKEKYVLNEARREEERMYHDMMIKNLFALKERDEENAKMQLLRRQEAKETFFEQMKQKEMRNERERQMKEFEKKQMEESVRKFKEEEERDFEERRRNNAERIAEYQEYLKREREIKERRRKEEEEIDKAFTILMQIEDKKEKETKKNDKERLKREMENYLENCREIQRLKLLEEQKTNELVEELSAKIRAQQDQNRNRLAAAKRELYNNVMKGRAEQVREKKERERREEEERNKEIELLNLHIEQQRRIREDYERRCEEKRMEYRRQLLDQITEFEKNKMRKKLEEEEHARQLQREEEKRMEETKAILEHCCSLPMHPMKQIIVNNPPRFDGGLPCPR